MNWKDKVSQGWDTAYSGMAWVGNYAQEHIPGLSTLLDFLTAQAAPMPAWALILIAVAAAATVFTPLYKPISLFETSVHEAGHGFAAWLVRLPVHGISVRRDSSGETRSIEAGRPRLAVFLAGGYPAPSFLAAVTAALLSTGYVNLCLILLWLGTLRLLWEAKGSFLGLVISALGLAGLSALGWYLDSRSTAAILTVFVCALTASSWRTLYNVHLAQRRNLRAVHDMTELSDLLGFSPRFWAKVLTLVTTINSITCLTFLAL